MSRCLGAKGHRAVGKTVSTLRLGFKDRLRGRTAVQAAGGSLVGKGEATELPNFHGVEPALVELVASLDAASLERIAVLAILEHRRLLDIAENAFGELQRSGSDETARDAYVCAMLNSKVQTLVVAFLVDRLGHVPEVPVS